MTQTEDTAPAAVPGATLPCQWCGRDVPQTPGAGRKRAYCAGRDCQDQAKRARAARRAAGGISGDAVSYTHLPSPRD